MNPYETAVEFRGNKDHKLGIARVRNGAAENLQKFDDRRLNYPPNPDREAAVCMYYVDTETQVILRPFQ